MAQTADVVTRYERVVEILDRAAAKSDSNYGGAGRFWFPLADLMEARVYGVRMIAPAEPARETCSCCTPMQTADGPRFPGRGAKSGLVRGLRGEAPFDDTQFPRLPWGGQPVSAGDIEFISDWIDDGCPDPQHEISIPATAQTTATSIESIPAENVEAEVRMWGVYQGAPSDRQYRYGEPKQRMNLDCLLPDQIAAVRQAFREMYRLDKWPEDRRNYNNLALIHQNHCQHGWERFLPWHRVYLYEFEQVMQDLCPGVTMPYWDWTMSQYVPDDPTSGSIIPESFKGFLTKESIQFLEKATPPLKAKEAAKVSKAMLGKLYTSVTAFFADVTATIGPEYAAGPHRDRFIDALLAANALWYPLRYPAEYGKEKTINDPPFQYHYPTGEDMEQIMALRTFRDFGGGSLYNDSFGYLDQNPHNTMHIWTGGLNPNPAPDPEFHPGASASNRNRLTKAAGRVFHSRDDMYSRPASGDMLSNLTASYDPVFWPIHANIDRLWSEWQQINPHSLPADLDAVLTPWSYTIADTLNMARFGYEYVKCSYVVPVGLSAPVGRFVSKPIEIPKPARKSFKQVEVRLHRVPQLPRSCFIRVFLNLPAANASTPIDHKNYAGYLGIFGHGSCIGGPGHCELPPSRAREYDLRPRNHNTPRNHRVNVTKTAKKLLDAGAESLQITLVVIGADYREDNELLRVDGVSLDFLD
ncbi:MAG TPA: tyrosinase family protein [Thermoanaerobaculia bacterium]|nr:tyrosinase family protein [Thermoanaerobaculia bacterium]